MTRIDYFSSSGNHNLPVASPLDADLATFHEDAHVAIGLFVDHCSDCACTRTRAGCGGFTDAAFPDSQVDRTAVEHFDEYYVRAIRKLRVNFDRFADLPPVQLAEVIDKNATIGISHLHRSDHYGHAIHGQRVTDHFITRRINRHRNGLSIKLRLAQL